MDAFPEELENFNYQNALIESEKIRQLRKTEKLELLIK